MNRTMEGCVRVRARLAELVDGALAPLEEARDRGHLEACTRCAEGLAHEERLLALLRDDSAADLDTDVALVAAAVRREIGSCSAPRRRGTRATAALLAAAAGIVFFLLMRSGGVRAPELPELAPFLARVPTPSEALSGLGSLGRELPR